jgi:D-alanyl-D-alanine carboxypeptidase
LKKFLTTGPSGYTFIKSDLFNKGGLVIVSIALPAPNGAPGRQLKSLAKRTKPGEPCFYVTDVNGRVLFEHGNVSQPIILAGLSKLYTTAMVLREFDRGALSPDTKASHVLPDKMLAGLCRVRGKDYSDDITISHLLSHRSGITDYFSHPRRGALSLLRQIQNRDRSWEVEQALHIARHYPGRFKPGAPGKIHYSDTNYQILGAVLKATTGLSFAQLLDIRIIDPLGLKQTYAFTTNTLEKFYELAPVSWRKEEMSGPQSLASFGADGCVVASAKDVAKFLRAFWSGRVTEESWIPKVWANGLNMTPRLSMGLGVMTYRMQRGLTPLVGHSGFTGGVALVDPTRRVFGAGSLNTVGYVHKPAKVLADIMKKTRAQAKTSPAIS